MKLNPNSSIGEVEFLVKAVEAFMVCFFCCLCVKDSPRKSHLCTLGACMERETQRNEDRATRTEREGSKKRPKVKKEKEMGSKELVNASSRPRLCELSRKTPRTREKIPLSRCAKQTSRTRGLEQQKQQRPREREVHFQQPPYIRGEVILGEPSSF